MCKYLLTVPMILLLLAGSASAQIEFSLQDLQGNTHRASDYRGKVLVLAIIGYG